jgi:hypothetical protein
MSFFLVILWLGNLRNEEKAVPTFDLTKLLSPKFWGCLILLAVIGWAGYKGYNWIWDRGYDKKGDEVAAQLATLTKERNDAVNKYTAYKGEYDNWVTNTKNAQEQLILQQQADLKATQERLAAAEEAARNKPVTIKEVIKYVPAQVDATYRLPSGLVRLYGDTLEGRPSPFDSRNQVPGSVAFDAQEASGLAVSQFGQIVASNNAECVLRGKVIDEWQGWYSRNKTAIDALVNWQKTYGPKPADNGDKPINTAIEPAPIN